MLQQFAADCTSSHPVASFCFIILLLFVLAYLQTKAPFFYWKEICLTV
jgi:hypothetical protein